MPLYTVCNNQLSLIEPIKLSNKNQLKLIIEKNIQVFFNCRFVDSEFIIDFKKKETKIDILALSSYNTPVIIEYSVDSDSSIISQSSYYLMLLKKFKDAYNEVVFKTFIEENIKVNWSNIRVICLSPCFKKWDLFVTKKMNLEIELWEYEYFSDGSIELDKIYSYFSSFEKVPGVIDKESNNLSELVEFPLKIESKTEIAIKNKKNDGLEANTKLWFIKNKFEEKIVNNKNSYNTVDLFRVADKKRLNIILQLRNIIFGIGFDIIEVPMRKFIIYRLEKIINGKRYIKNLAEIEIEKEKILLSLRIDPIKVNKIPTTLNELMVVKHHLGDYEITITNEEDLIIAKNYVFMAYNEVMDFF